MKNNASRLSGIAVDASKVEQVSAQRAGSPGAATERHPASVAKRVGVVWLTLAVVTVHLALLHWASSRLSAHVGSPAAKPAAHRWLLARALAAPATARDMVPTARPAAAVAPKTTSDDTRARPSHPAAVAEPVTSDAAAVTAPEATAAVETRFYGYDEVETAAEPQADWTIDVQALDALALSRIVVTLWIDERGNVLRCTVDEPERLSPAERDALAERIARTPLRPARRGGLAVASKRRIELTTTGG